MCEKLGIPPSPAQKKTFGTFGFPPLILPAPLLEMYTIHEKYKWKLQWGYRMICDVLSFDRKEGVSLRTACNEVFDIWSTGCPKKSDSILLVAFLGHPRVVWYLCGTFSTAFPCEKTKKRWTKFPRVESSTILHLLKHFWRKKHHKNCECCPGYTECQSLLTNPKCHD